MHTPLFAAIEMWVGVCAIFTGTTAPVACPEGSWSNSSGLRVQDECKPCLGGFYCDSAGLTKPSGPCSGGYTRLINLPSYHSKLIITAPCAHNMHITLSCSLMQILLCRGSRHIHPYWWIYRGTLSWGLLLPRGSCPTCALWSRDICCCNTCYSVWALCAGLALCVWLSVLVSCRFVLMK